MNAESIVNQAGNLQAPSQTVLKLLDLLNRPHADHEDVVETVGRDVVLSAKLLALCNSAGYGLTQPVASLEQAVFYLGYGEIHRLVMALSFGGQINVHIAGYDMEAGTLWHHSLLTALLTPRVLGLSGKFNANNSVAYTAGLLHDIGKLILGQSMDESVRTRIQEMVQQQNTALRRAESSVLGCDHAEVGACLLTRWRIPAQIVDAVRNHHCPGREQPPISAAIHIADAIAHQIGASPGWSSLALELDPSALTSLHLTPQDVETLTMVALDLEAQVAQQERITPGARPGQHSEPFAHCQT